LDRKIKIGTRGSQLALWQAHYLQAELQRIGLDSELVIIKTQGDRIQHLSFDKIEGKGFFTKELEEALLANEVDLAVHSMKDLPTQMPEGLVLAGVSYREDPADWLLVRQEAADASQMLGLPASARVGTSSARRKAQLLDMRPDLQLADLRGNVPTRIEKLRSGECDAIMLAAAGLSRLQLDLSGLNVERFSPREFAPAPAQGVLAYQVRETDLDLRRALKPLHHPDVAARTNVERKVLQLMGGGCHLPLGVYCEVDTLGYYHVWAAMAEQWDAPLRRTRLSSGTSAGLAEQVAQALKAT
jgi:hydroxymethylbilane synthase